MKKHLRGKRYLKSRASVAVGRRKRAERKTEMLIYAIRNIDWQWVTQNIIDALSQIGATARLIAANIEKQRLDRTKNLIS